MKKGVLIIAITVASGHVMEDVRTHVKEQQLNALASDRIWR